jgi:hypothetical protein
MGVIGIRIFSAREKVPATSELIQVFPLSGEAVALLTKAQRREVSSPTTHSSPITPEVEAAQGGERRRTERREMALG